MSPSGPYKLVTVNTAPDRARRLIGRVVEAVKDKYTIIHAANVDNEEDVPAVVKAVQPDVLFTASMWSPEQSQRIRDGAQEIVPGLKTYALPQGLQVDKGPDAVVEHILEKLPSIIEG
ncbi:hypothetical protein LTS18_007359 [Coniosporium uncinatum]|uniref:Uncharacterized protein n=1 Tax=Coniosporium uncinatum TaxID=93489 RepID=A0ACC3DPQ4_9PEZI|nr:hypothetical protein LTS18_007359 [Coniosporium uncinatum]